MPFILYFIFFLATATAAYVGMHYFVLLGTIEATGVGRDTKAARILKISFLAAGLMFLAGEFLSRTPTAARIRPFITAGGLWVGFLVMTFFLLALRSAFSALLKNPVGRRYSAAAAIALGAAAATFGAFNAGGPPAIRRINLETEKLAAGAKLTIVHLSDLHLNYAKTDKWVAGLVDIVNSFDADIVAVTGDLMDARLCDFNNFCELMGGIKARSGVFAVTGNHEYYVGIDKFRAFARDAGIKILSNENAAAGKNVLVIGINDDEAARNGDDGPDFDKAAKGADFSRYALLLYHRPRGFEKHAAKGVDLQLSGHTHAGQIPPADLIVRLTYRFPYGLYRLGKSALYTTSGTSTWGPPMRLFSKSEITVFTVNGTTGGRRPAN